MAYADFVTAMMAFFLLLWLLGVTTTEQRAVIADYFSPAGTSAEDGGSGGVLGGLTITVPGALVSSGGPLLVEAGHPAPPAAPGRDGDAEVAGAERLPGAALREERRFAEAEERLLEMIGGFPELAGSIRSVAVDKTPAGLRIQLLDRDDHAMFPLGSARMGDETRRLLGLVAKAVAPLPNRLSISGHTDGTRFAGDGAYGNWELSTDRANAARRALVEAGLDEARIVTVVGRADRDPLMPEKPDDPRNRRIGIVLLRDHPAPPSPGAGRGTASASPSSPGGEAR